MSATTEAITALKFQPLEPPKASDHPGRPRFPRRGKIKASGAGFRLRREFLKRSSRLPETPLLSWKFDEENGTNGYEKSSGEGSRGIRSVISARKLAAGLWHRSLANVGRELGHQAGAGNFAATFQCRRVDRVHPSRDKDLANIPHSISCPKSDLRYKFPPLFQFPSSAIEGATKWDPDGWKASGETEQISGQPKPSNHGTSATRAISALEAELCHTRTRITELETKRKSSTKKVEQFFRKINEERAAWRIREHEKIGAIIDDVNADLSREKKNHQRLEIVNSKLVNELADANVLTKRYLQEYRKEKRARELVEAECNKLAKELREDKTEVDAIRSESMKLQEEVEDERTMLQMAEVWREERVQMKLVDAKVMLEEKYAQMNRGIEDLTFFLKSRCMTSDKETIKKADLLLQVASAINMHDVRELTYQPPSPDDIFSVFEDVNNMSPDGVHKHPNAYTEDDASEWETSSNPENEGSSYSPDQGDETPTAYVYSVSGRKPKNISSISKLWRSYPSVKNGSPKDLAAQWRSPYSGNPHTTQATTSLKAQLLEARTEGQKIQLRHVLEHKI